MQFTKTCGCIVDYQQVDPNSIATAPELKEVVVSYCEPHSLNPENLEDINTLVFHSN